MSGRPWWQRITRKNSKKATQEPVVLDESYNSMHHRVDQMQPITSSQTLKLNDKNGKLICRDYDIKKNIKKYMSNKNNFPHINNWDVSQVTDMSGLFSKYPEFDEDISDWVVSNVTNMEDMFKGCTKFNQPLKWLETSKVTNMKSMFEGCIKFNQKLNWDTSKVTSMKNMFKGCAQFNQPLNWNTSKVKNMSAMFEGCIKFNKPLEFVFNRPYDSKPNIPQEIEMKNMFEGCAEFNQPLNWTTSKVTDMTRMFEGCAKFNQPLNWTTSKLLFMSGIFKGCSNFNQVLDWDTSKVTRMSAVFEGCVEFNQPLNWNTSNVTTMSSMFKGCTDFNQLLHWGRSKWNTLKVTDMDSMFEGCSQFNQPLNWNTLKVEFMNSMFEGCTNFNQDLTRLNIRRAYENNHIQRMFEGCANMIQTNYPRSHPQYVEIVNRNRVNPIHVHNEAAKVNFEKLAELLEKQIRNNPGSRITSPADIDIKEYIIRSLNEIFEDVYKDDDRVDTIRESFKRIKNERLNNMTYENKPINALYYALKFTKLQDYDFKKMYIDTFIEDCINAHSITRTNRDTITCGKGAWERIIMQLIPAFTAELNKRENEDYQTILDVLKYNPTKLITMYITDWFKMYKKNGENFTEIEKLHINERKEKLKTYLKELLQEGELEKKLIKDNIDALDFHDDDFDTTYNNLTGGKKSRKNIKYKKRKTYKSNSNKIK